ncbi:hypothetical protein BDR06DRAFT_954353 [Suillus hirtellus]|nr:hypothetical protein BDR06DRAFT_954353 [Suillus hirtellus]
MTCIATSAHQTLTHYREREVISTWIVAGHLMLAVASAGKSLDTLLPNHSREFYAVRYPLPFMP